MRVRSLKLGDCLFDNGRRAIIRDGEIYRLEPRDYAVFMPLLDSAPNAVSTNALLRRAWHNKIVGDNALHQSIGRLRKALGDDARNPSYIQTLPKMGYQLIADVTPLPRLEDWQVEISPIAVMPFRDFTGGEHGFLIDTLCFGISHHLMQDRVDVLRLDLSAHGNRATLSDMGAAMKAGARTTLEGVLIVENGRLSLNCTLVEVDTRQQLWSQCYDLGTPEMFELPGELARTIVAGIAERLDVRRGPKRSALRSASHRGWGSVRNI